VVVEGDGGLHFFFRARSIASTLQAKPSEEVRQMTYVVVEPCVNCRYTDCAVVCPVEAFHLDDDMLVINPETCIDCDACVPECPVEAIFPEDKVPEEWAHYTQMNAEKSLSGLPTISDKLDPLC
jgi:ferredoxin